MKITLLILTLVIFLCQYEFKITRPNWHKIDLQLSIKDVVPLYTHYVRYVGHERHHFNIVHIWSKLAMHWITSLLYTHANVTFTLTFDLLLKKLNLDNNFWANRAKSRKYQGVFEVKSRVKTWQVRGIWSFIFHMCISCGMTLLLEKIDLVPLSLLLTYFWKKINLDHSFWTKVIGL